MDVAEVVFVMSYNMINKCVINIAHTPTKQLKCPGACAIITMIARILFTGAEHGLSLTLNVEQYEHTVGPSYDAGIKVDVVYHGPLVRYVKLRVAQAPGILGTFSPATTG